MCRSAVRKQLFLNSGVCLFCSKSHLVLSLLAALHLYVSTSSYLILSSKAQKCISLNLLLGVFGINVMSSGHWQDFWLQRKWSGRVAFANCNVL